MPRKLLFIMVLVAIAVPALALNPIDDFEVAPFFFQTTDAYQENDIFVDAPSHVIWSPRTVILEPAGPGDFISAQLVPTYGDDAAEVLIIGDGKVRFKYDWGFPNDITRNGTFDRVEVDFSFVTPGAALTLATGDGTFACGIKEFPASTSGSISWSIDNWCNADVTAAEFISLTLDGNGSDAIFEVTDIRFHRSGAIMPDLNPHLVATQAPPMPSSPLAWSTYDLFGQPLYRTDMVFESITPVGGTTDLTADFQVQTALGGEIGHSTIMWNDAQGFFEAEFQISVDFSPANGWTPEIIYPPDPFHGEGGLAITTGLLLRDGGGAPRGTSCIRMIFTEGHLQDLNFDVVTVTQTSSSKQAVNDGLDITFTIFPNNFDYVFPLFEVEWICDWVPFDPTDVATPLPELDSPLRLVAMPSVTRGGTEIRTNRPIGATRSVEIYDIVGRLVRALELPGGGTSVHWDGLNTSGVAAASGPYFARIRGAGSQDGVAKIMRLR